MQILTRSCSLPTCSKRRSRRGSGTSSSPGCPYTSGRCLASRMETCLATPRVVFGEKEDKQDKKKKKNEGIEEEGKEEEEEKREEGKEKKEKQEKMLDAINRRRRLHSGILQISPPLSWKTGLRTIAILQVPY